MFELHAPCTATACDARGTKDEREVCEESGGRYFWPLTARLADTTFHFSQTKFNVLVNIKESKIVFTIASRPYG